jgi:hypothetical protein
MLELELENNGSLLYSTCMIEGWLTLDHIIAEWSVTSPLAMP